MPEVAASPTREPSSTSRHRIVTLLRAAAGSLYSTLFPSECRLCGIPLISATRLPICEECIESIAPIGIPRCSICGEGLPIGYRAFDSEARCNDCGREFPLFARAVAYGAYEGGLRELIHLLKYQRVEPAAQVLGRMLADSVASLESEFDGSVLVIPVPLHGSKLRQRGFNQSELIARNALFLLRRGASSPGYEMVNSLLVRKRPTESQVGMTREQRQANMKGAFAVLDKQRVAGRSVLLVDDVFTTGTTAGECSRVLLKAGAQNVWVATVARALKTKDTVEKYPQQREEEAHSLAAHAP